MCACWYFQSYVSDFDAVNIKQRPFVHKAFCFQPSTNLRNVGKQ